MNLDNFIRIKKNGVHRLTTMHDFEKKFKRLGYQIEEFEGDEDAKREGIQGNEEGEQKGKEKGKKK